MAEQKLYNINDGVTGRDGGPYLDEVQAREIEVRRAQVEGREPSDELQPHAGMQLVPAALLVPATNTTAVPSQEASATLAAAFDDSKIGAKPAATVTDTEPASEDNSKDTSSTSTRRS